MPSFASLSALAIALLSVSPVMALGSESEVHQLSKRRPNHADAYGYPHGLGPHKGTRKMFPGGYAALDPHPSNFGATCKYNAQCHSKIPLSTPICTSDLVCDFKCLGDTIKSDGQCVGSFKEYPCKYDHNCPRSKLGHGSAVCNDGKCSFQCDAGWHAVGSKCKKDITECGGVTCDTVEDGYNVCVDDVCTPKCASYLGYSLYKNADGSILRCIKTASDPDNCGAPGTTCPDGYNGLGQPTCSSRTGTATCGLNCHGYYRKTMSDGTVYCSSTA